MVTKILFDKIYDETYEKNKKIKFGDSIDKKYNIVICILNICSVYDCSYNQGTVHSYNIDDIIRMLSKITWKFHTVLSENIINPIVYQK